MPRKWSLRVTILIVMRELKAQCHKVMSQGDELNSVPPKLHWDFRMLSYLEIDPNCRYNWLQVSRWHSVLRINSYWKKGKAQMYREDSWGQKQRLEWQEQVKCDRIAGVTLHQEDTAQSGREPSAGVWLWRLTSDFPSLEVGSAHSALRDSFCGFLLSKP